MNDKKLDFAIVLHCHQPVGNFDQVMQEAFDKAYLPFINILANHPKIKVTLHYSGCLLDWLKEHQSGFLKTLKNLARCGQIEFMSGGYYEPVLSLIPDIDKLAQIRILSQFIEKNFSQKPTGFWLAERVWEPYFVKILSQAGISYVVVDDTHFKNAFGQEEEVYDYYISDSEDSTLFIFPGSEKLRYMLPFKLPQESIEYLRQAKEKGANSVCFADDGEKFGFWPKTYKWVYEEKWLDNFFTALEKNSSWLNTATLSRIVKGHKPKGSIYLPCASYREMLEWSGGYFNNFLVKYPEANWMQKRMLDLSRELNKLKIKNNTLQNAKRHLYMSQCNCAYWHGVFGGLYLGHLRQAIFNNLIEAEKLKEKNTNARNFLSYKISDIDKDGSEEIALKNKLLDIFISPSSGGTILELDYKPKSLNLTNTLSRRMESYHHKIVNPFTPSHNPALANSPQSIHELTLVKEEHLEDYLIYDNYRKVSLIDHFLSEKVSANDFARGNYTPIGNFINRPFKPKIKLIKNEARVNLNSQGLVQNKEVSLNKEIKIFKDKSQLVINYRIGYLGDEPLNVYFGTEFNFYLYNSRFTAPGSLAGLTSWNFLDEWYGLNIQYTFNQPADLIYFPVETVSDSESGLERNYQGLSQIFFWPLILREKETLKIEMALSIES